MSRNIDAQITQAADILSMIPEGAITDYKLQFTWDGTAEVYGYVSDPRKARTVLYEAGAGRRHWAKSYDDYSVTFTAKTETGLKLKLVAPRGNVCKLVETGEIETIEVKDYENVPTKTVTRPVTEWVCK